MLISYCCFISTSKYGAELAALKFVLSWHRFDRRSIFPGLFLHFFQKPSIKKNVLSKLLKVAVHLHVLSTSTFAGFAAEFFCIHYFLKTKPGSTKTITELCFSCQNKSVCQKLACSCKKWKSTQKVIYAIFVRKYLVIIRFLEKELQVSKELLYCTGKSMFCYQLRTD